MRYPYLIKLQYGGFMGCPYLIKPHCKGVYVRYPYLIKLDFKGVYMRYPYLIGLHYTGAYMRYPYLIKLDYKGFYMRYPYLIGLQHKGGLYGIFLSSFLLMCFLRALPERAPRPCTKAWTKTDW